MELVAAHFALADVADRGEVRVSHVQAGLARGLDLHEDVVVHCTDGEFLGARVVGLEFELEDTLYLLDIGVRLPPAEAAVLLGAEPADVVDRHRAVTVQEVLGLLGELRRELPPPPRT